MVSSKAGVHEHGTEMDSEHKLTYEIKFQLDALIFLRRISVKTK